MSLISIKDIGTIKEKTLIYFYSSIALFALPGSYTYQTPANLSDLISDLRSFNLPDFPIICYDSENMKLSSQAYWIFKALGYKVHVLYGGTDSCEEEEIELTKDPLIEVPTSADIKTIDSQLLPSRDSNSVTIKNLPFFIYEVLGRDITQEKVKKLLAAHGISYEYDNVVISGYDAAVFGVILEYLEQTNIKVFLGEWSENKVLTENSSVVADNFYSVANTVYYDAFSGNTERDAKREEPRSAKNNRTISEITHYNIPSTYVKQNHCEYQPPSASHYCKCIIS